MKKVLALALLSSITFGSVQAMDMDKMKVCLKVCMVPAACMMMQKMVCKEPCPMRSAGDSSQLLGDVTNKLVDGSIVAALQRVYNPASQLLGVTYANDVKSVVVDSAVNAVVTEVDSRLGLSSLNPKLQALVQTSVGKLAYVSVLNALAKALYSYVQSQVSAEVNLVAKK